MVNTYPLYSALTMANPHPSLSYLSPDLPPESYPSIV